MDKTYLLLYLILFTIIQLVNNINRKKIIVNLNIVLLLTEVIVFLVLKSNSFNFIVIFAIAICSLLLLFFSTRWLDINDEHIILKRNLFSKPRYLNIDNVEKVMIDNKFVDGETQLHIIFIVNNTEYIIPFSFKLTLKWLQKLQQMNTNIIINYSDIKRILFWENKIIAIIAIILGIVFLWQAT